MTVGSGSILLLKLSSHRLPRTPGGLRESNSVREELPASSVAPADGSSNVAGNHDGGGSAAPISGSGMGDLDVVCCWLQTVGVDWVASAAMVDDGVLPCWWSGGYGGVPVVYCRPEARGRRAGGGALSFGRARLSFSAMEPISLSTVLLAAEMEK
nr:hypothetical protein Iba_chr02aCG4040 [Ipomoea batatas]